MWVNKFKSLNEELEKLARQQVELASQHKWTEIKKLPHADDLIVKTWNALPVTYSTLQRTNLRSRLTDESLNACMKLNLTAYQPDYKAISKTMQSQKSY
ncbi:General transcription factor II-I repeat domain-containing protein 2-like [Caligus rogercresseyi]|uniref:General transcription factor II-I repeat domain-containing protein 2-like n=1 Tax=Caligus rogercresseyi TaxID=217165 RepID=A0A7T8QTY1_CALRO|nr:General transcription factor II-I repeat domain-containing protein 2-like [Caligus rogercresseyi]